jgi:hypothetical protein
MISTSKKMGNKQGETVYIQLSQTPGLSVLVLDAT